MCAFDKHSSFFFCVFVVVPAESGFYVGNDIQTPEIHISVGRSVDVCKQVQKKIEQLLLKSVVRPVIAGNRFGPRASEQYTWLFFPEVQFRDQWIECAGHRILISCTGGRAVILG